MLFKRNRLHKIIRVLTKLGNLISLEKIILYIHTGSSKVWVTQCFLIKMAEIRAKCSRIFSKVAMHRCNLLNFFRLQILVHLEEPRAHYSQIETISTQQSTLLFMERTVSLRHSANSRRKVYPLN